MFIAAIGAVLAVMVGITVGTYAAGHGTNAGAPATADTSNGQ
ncbi:MAG: hypothetical protein WBL23_04800 [Salinisphaera sp.]